MNRRDTLKQLFLASGGLIALPSWARKWSAKDFTTFHSSFSVTEQEILASITDTIIPAGDSIGALSVGVEKFLEKLIDNCYGKEVQDNVKAQLAGLETSAQRIYGKSFIACDQSQRQELLLKLSSSENRNEKDFFNLMKSETIRGFTTSKEVMLKYLKYKVAPGHYFGCVDVKA
jgi:hypothetical protein